jgi:hypothetical protein
MYIKIVASSNAFLKATVAEDILLQNGSEQIAVWQAFM